MFVSYASNGHVSRVKNATVVMNRGSTGLTSSDATIPTVCAPRVKARHVPKKSCDRHSLRAPRSPIAVLRPRTTLPLRKLETMCSSSSSDTHNYATEDDIAQPVVEDWVKLVSDFWTSEGVGERDVRELVKLGEDHEHLRDVDLLEACASRMRLLLPDCKIEVMVQREPDCLKLNFTHAAHLMLQLQEFIGSERASEVTTVFERYPALLLVEDVPSAISRAIDHIIQLKPVFEESEVNGILRRHPHLIYRVLYFEEFDVLPYDIKNHLWHRTYAEQAKANEWNDQWNTWGDAEDAMKTWYEEHWDDNEFDD